MCLSTITSSKNLPNATGYGWKVMSNMDNKIITPCFATSLAVGRWHKDKRQYKLKDNYSDEYKTGFHIFATRQAARLYKRGTFDKVYKVKYRHVVATGTQWDGLSNEYLPALVVREIMLLPRTKKIKVKAKK